MTYIQHARAGKKPYKASSLHRSKLKKKKRKKDRIKRRLKKQYTRYSKKHYNLHQIMTPSSTTPIEESDKSNNKTKNFNTKQMGILISTIRVFGFRGLQNIEVELEEITVLTGTNNSGKTSLLKALQIALGNRQFISQDDFNISGNNTSKNIIIDILIKPTAESVDPPTIFNEEWEILFTDKEIRTNADGLSFIPIRTIVSFDEINNIFKSKQYILNEWTLFQLDDGTYWYQIDNGNEKSFYHDEVPFFYVDAQRDILEDMKIRSSYLGKMISKIEYKPEDIKLIEKQIKDLNEHTVSRSDILSNIKLALKELDTAMDSSSEGVEITPFTKRLRDLSKGLTIYYTDKKDSFSMEYHGMGTRSWSSLLTLKAFISLLNNNAGKEEIPFFPIVALEEPEAHLHPNAQKKLYSQLSAIAGQKIIATHSPYIAASAELNQIRSFYKENGPVVCGRIKTNDFTTEDLRKISRQVVNTRGEIFFSKVLVFFEGETEEQALPIFAKSYFDRSSVELGVDFIGVGGYGNYLPFLRVAEALNIPWFIFSDAENTVKQSVKSQFDNCSSDKVEDDVIVFLDDDNNFETQLIKEGYFDEIKKAILAIELPKCANERHREAKEKQILALDITQITEIITKSKAIFGPEIADAIIGSTKPLPSSVIKLFEKIAVLLKK